MAKALARQIGYVYIDSGAMYRAVTLYAMEHDMISEDGIVNVSGLVDALPLINISFSVNPQTGLQETYLNGKNVEQEIRTLRVSNHVSPVSAIPQVRERLSLLQREFGIEKGIVMDGRDIGTTIFPDAEMKVFVDASPEVRAQRRFKELQEKGMPADYQAVLNNIKERDHIDRTRAVSPLKKADDAHVLVNDHVTIPEHMEWLMALYHKIVDSL